MVTVIPAGITIESPQVGTRPHDQVPLVSQLPEAVAVQVAAFENIEATTKSRIKIVLFILLYLNIALCNEEIPPQRPERINYEIEFTDLLYSNIRNLCMYQHICINSYKPDMLSH